MHTTTPLAAVAVSEHLDTRTAATEVADRLFDELGTSPCDLLMVFGSYHHRSAFDDAAAIIRRTISPQALVGVTAEGVIGDGREMEGLAGLSALALRLPGATITPWLSTQEDPMPLGNPQAIRERIGLAQNPDRFRGTLLFGDPFTTPITRLLPAITNCGTVSQSPNQGASSASDENDQSSIVSPQSLIRPIPVPVLGGMASGASQPGLNVMVVNDRAVSAGAVGVGLAGDFNIDFVLSQGCRPIGEPVVITKCQQNLVLELGGRKAMAVLQEMAQSLSDADKRLLSRGLLVGTVINEYKQRFGRGDFLVRNVMGFDQRVGGIAIGEMCKVGQTIQFHVRDANTATEDLQLLLDAQMVKDEPPFAAMLFSCNSRGNRLFNEANHDVNIIRRRFGGDMPLAGFFAAGEFGPIGDRSYLHGHTASLALLRGTQGD